MGSKPRRQARESKHEIASIGSLTYKNYKPVETEDGKKIYVSPEDEKKILLSSKMNESEFNRRESRSSDSSYEIPVKPQPASAVRQEHGHEEEYSSQAAPTQNVVRHTFPFYGRKWRLFPQTNKAKTFSVEEARQFLKLPPHIEQIMEGRDDGDGLRRNFKFPRLFRRNKSRCGFESESEKIVEAVSDPGEGQSSVEVNIENTELFDEISEKQGPRKRCHLNLFLEDCSVKCGNNGTEGNAEGSMKPKDIATVTFKTIFGIERNNGTSVKKDLLVRENAGTETEGKAEEAEEFNGGIDDGMESKRMSLKFPVIIPPRGRWGPKSRRQETKSAPEMNVDGEEDVPSRLWKNNKKGRRVSLVGEGTALDSRSDTESADHGSTDKSSVSKLTEDKQQKRFIEQLLDTIKRKNKDKISDNEALRNLPVTMDNDLEQQIQKEQLQKDNLKNDGIVYAELDMTRSQGTVVRRDDEKTEYAEIIHPKANEFQRNRDELRKSRENLSCSREHVTEDDGTTLTPDGKKEAAV